MHFSLSVASYSSVFNLPVTYLFQEQMIYCELGIHNFILCHDFSYSVAIPEEFNILHSICEDYFNSGKMFRGLHWWDLASRWQKLLQKI